MGLTEILALSVPLLFILSMFTFLIITIYLDHKKHMAMIEKGLIHEDEKSKPENMIGWGIAILGIGITLSIGWMFNYNELVMIGLVLASIGIALLVSYLIKKKSK